MDESIARLAVIVLPLVRAITLHEAAHGYVALMKGDPTAHLAGRITANPLKHIDPIGTILVPLVMYFVGAMAGHEGLLFGLAPRNSPLASIPYTFPPHSSGVSC